MKLPDQAKSIVYLGADPGMSGAIAAQVASGAVLGITDFPTVRRNRLEPNIAGLMNFLSPFAQKCECIMTIEEVFTFGSQHDTPLTAWQLSAAFWSLRTVAASCGIKVAIVPPATWKRHYRHNGERLWGMGREAGKATEIQLVKEKFPQFWPCICPRHKSTGKACNPSSDRAEALLISNYGRLRHLGLLKEAA